MNRNPTIVVALTAVVLAATGCAPGTGSASDSATTVNVRQAITKRLDDYIAAARADRIDALPDYWTEHAQAFEPESEYHSRAEMIGMLTEVLKTMKIGEMAIHTADLFVHDNGTVAYQYGNFDETLNARDGKAPPMRGRSSFSIRWVKEPDGVWRVDRLIETPMPKLPTATKAK